MFIWTRNRVRHILGNVYTYSAERSDCSKFSTSTLPCIKIGSCTIAAPFRTPRPTDEGVRQVREVHLPILLQPIGQIVVDNRLMPPPPPGSALARKQTEESAGEPGDRKLPNITSGAFVVR